LLSHLCGRIYLAFRSRQFGVVRAVTGSVTGASYAMVELWVACKMSRSQFEATQGFCPT
jgi:hypothetical protein